MNRFQIAAADFPGTIVEEPDAQTIVAEAVTASGPWDAVGSAAVDCLNDARHLYDELRRCCQHAIQGRDDVIDLALNGLLADGHVLLEDHPGSGKTTLAKTIGGCIARPEPEDDYAAFRRIQFTPDLLPSDVTGTTVFEPETGSLCFRPGPVFANVVLADEINRTSPKVQAALLEAMAEKQVTVDNRTHQLEDLFLVLGTQNPFDQAGTYPLPRAQLDRFLFKVRMVPLSREQTLEVLTKWQTARRQPYPLRIKPEAIVKARAVVRESVHIADAILDGLADIKQALWQDRRVIQGVSERSLILALPALQVRAMTQGRDYVSHLDLRELSVPLFAHRLELRAGVKDATAVVTESLQPVLEKLARRTMG